MRAALLGALVLLAGCACPEKRSTQLLREAQSSPPRASYQPPRCTTTCGLKADLDDADCAALNAAEARALHYLTSTVPEFRPGWVACSDLDGYKLIVETTRSPGCGPDGWRDRWGRCVIGLTSYTTHEMRVQDKAFTYNSLAHEIAHVLDHEFGTEQGYEHCGWEARGIKAGILKATGQRDEAAENCD